MKNDGCTIKEPEMEAIRDFPLDRMTKEKFRGLQAKEQYFYARLHLKALLTSLAVNIEDVPDEISNLRYDICLHFERLLRAREEKAHVYYDPPGKPLHADQEVVGKQLQRSDISICEDKTLATKPITFRDALQFGIQFTDRMPTSGLVGEQIIDKMISQSSVEEIILAAAELDVLISSREQFRLSKLYGTAASFGRNTLELADEELLYHLSDQVEVVARRSMRAANHYMRMKAAFATEACSQKQEDTIDKTPPRPKE